MSVSGERSNSTCSISVNRRSSMSSSDMWQPKQPASEVVATRSLRGAAQGAAHSWASSLAGGGLLAVRFVHPVQVVAALADRIPKPTRLGISAPTGQMPAAWSCTLRAESANGRWGC
jgi:hypothetical protein